VLGKTETLTVLIILLATVAVVSDFLYRKIYNWSTFPIMAVGLAYGFMNGGSSGLLQSFIGIVVGLIAYGILYTFRILGAGDVKLLMAFGSLGGILFVADIAVLAIFVGGAMAIPLLIFKGRLRPFLEKIKRFLITSLHRGPRVEFPVADESLKMPFGISIAIAAVWIYLDNPLIRWGVRPW
jgi:prepilin peptidase CpaA